MEAFLEERARVDRSCVVPARHRITRRRWFSWDGRLAIVKGFRRSLFSGDVGDAGSER